MTVLDYILDGIEAELALERELGVRSIACDRAILSVDAHTSASTSSSPVSVVGPAVSRSPEPQAVVRDPAALRTHVPQDTQAGRFDFIFLHHRALPPDGVAMMAKIVTAMGKTPETAPIVFTGDLPPAKVYVVLGGNALRKWFPGTPGAPGQWAQTSLVPNVLVTYSPEYILRFGTVSPAVRKLKRDMWTSLKSVLQRI